MSDTKTIFVLKHPSVLMPALQGAAFVEWEQICHRKDVHVFIDYKRRDDRRLAKMDPVMAPRVRPWRVMARDWTVVATCGSLQSALRIAQEYA